MNFVVVEDNSLMRRAIANTVSKIGENKIFEAENVEQAFVIMEANPIDFIITDWIMEDIDGIEFIKRVKTNEKYKDLPVLMISTKADKIDILHAFSVKVDDYIVKPISQEIVEKKISNICEKKGILDKLSKKTEK